MNKLKICYLIMTIGVDLIMSTLCNATLCTAVNNVPDRTWNFQDESPILPSTVMLRRTEADNLDSINILAKEINGKHLKIATYINQPMSAAKPDPHNKGKLVGDGVAFFIMDILREKFNFTYDIVLAKKNYIMGGSKPEDSLIGLVTTRKVDMAAAFVANILEFQQLVTFSVPIEEETWVMILKRPRESAVGEGLLAPFTNIVWVLILASVVTFGPCIYILTQVRAKLMPVGEPPVPIFRSIWFVYGSLIKQGTNLRPKANTTRVLFTTWWLYVMLLSAFYMANLTAFLTLSQFTLEIKGPEDLMRKNYPWLAAGGGIVEFAVTKPTGNMYYLNEMVKKKRGQFQAYTSINDFLRKVDKGEVLIKSATTAILGLYHNYMKKTKLGVPEKDRCSYVVAPTPFTKNMRGFIYPKNSTLKTLFDSVIGIIIQSGIVEELKKIKFPNVKVCPMDLQMKDRKLQVTDLMMTYQITVGGLCAAIAVFIGEIIFKRHIAAKGNQITEVKNIKNSKRTNCAINDDIDSPPSYDAIFGKVSKIIPTKRAHKKVINGREYLVVDCQEGIRLIPTKSTSALLYKLEKN